MEKTALKLPCGDVVTHLSEGVVGTDGAVVDSRRRKTLLSVQQPVVGSYNVRPRTTTNAAVTIVYDLSTITVFIVVAVIASRLPHEQPYTLCRITH